MFSLRIIRQWVELMAHLLISSSCKARPHPSFVVQTQAGPRGHWRKARCHAFLLDRFPKTGVGALIFPIRFYRTNDERKFLVAPVLISRMSLDAARSSEYLSVSLLHNTKRGCHNPVAAFRRTDNDHQKACL